MVEHLSGTGSSSLIVTGMVQPLLSMVLSALVVMGSPGPATISAAAAGAAYGARRARAYVCGIILGTTTVLAAVSAGLVSLLQSQPGLGPALLVLSVAYMLYLAYRIATAPPLPGLQDDVAAPGFMPGFLLAASNPKAYFALSAVVGGATLGTGSALAEAGVKFAVLAAMIVVVQAVWLVAGASFARLLRDPLSARIVNLVFAALLVLATVATLLPA